MTCTPYQILFVSANEKCGAVCVAREEKAEVPTGFRCGNLLYRDHFEDLAVDGRIILKY